MKFQNLNTAPDNQTVLNFMRNPDWHIFLFKFVCSPHYFSCSCEAGKALVDDQCVPFCELDVCLEGMVCVQHATSFE